MALFQRSLHGDDPSFTSLFRLLDDFDTYSRGTRGHGHGRRHVPSFSPRFDVRETATGYELHGELPGIDGKDVNIEFTEPQTMVVSGRVERNYSSGTPPNEVVEDTQMSGAITESEKPSKEASHQATVSDEETESAKEQGEYTPSQSTVATPAQTSSKVESNVAKPVERVWHQERSIGHFQRTFTFPSRVDEAAVSASLQNGILHVTIPKAAKHETRRVEVS